MKAILLLIIALLLVDCSSKPADETTSDPAQDVSSATESKAGKDVLLKGVYVTSTDVPHEKYDDAHLFDNNKATYWATMPGAGPDEGIMLYFQEPQNISTLQLTQPAGDEFAGISELVIYINGQDPLYRKVSDQIEIAQEGVKSIYIRISRIDNTEDITDGTEGFTSVSFDAKKSAAISELSLSSNGDKLNLILPDKVGGNIKASSTLAPEISYGVRNLFDSRREFAWAEGSKGTGENESISIDLTDEIELTGLKVSNGFQRSEKHYLANARPKSLSISNESGETVDVGLLDDQGEQNVALSKALIGKSFTIKIKDVYPGTSYKDLVISELKLVSNNRELIVRDNLTEGIKNDLLKKVKGTILEKYVDRRMANNFEEIEGYKRSIILRSDYTFVAYNESWTEGDDTEELVADGNWEIKSMDNEKATIRVFGKLTRISQTIDYYAGNTEVSQQQIFQDFLTIDMSGVKGEKFIPEIKNAVAATQ